MIEVIPYGPSLYFEKTSPYNRFTKKTFYIFQTYLIFSKEIRYGDNVAIKTFSVLQN